MNNEFIWNDDLVKEFIRETFNREPHNYLPMAIQQFKKSKKKPLFITEDGKEIFESDKYWITYGTTEIKDYIALPGFSFPNIGDSKRFSTKEAAEEYILYNLPCLSVNDIVSLSNYLTAIRIEISRKELEDIAKEKINAIKK